MIIYIKNNANEIPEVLPSLDNLMADHFENYEIIVVNDASRDESYHQIRKAAKDLKRDITLINLAWVHGPEKGIMAGVDHSRGTMYLK